MPHLFCCSVSPFANWTKCFIFAPIVLNPQKLFLPPFLIASPFNSDYPSLARLFDFTDHANTFWYTFVLFRGLFTYLLARSNKKGQSCAAILNDF